jgi:uncharacterized phage protein (TIGR01671 family)
MRTIKFRAWEEKTKTMILPEMMVASMSFDGRVFEQADNEAGQTLNTDWIVMQFTGLTDKNGKEIYEGDILKCIFMIDYDLFREPEFVEVKFENGKFVPMTLEKRNQYSNHPYYYSYEVVGNVYENPELLK